jgi:hypothetical protein
LTEIWFTLPQHNEKVKATYSSPTDSIFNLLAYSTLNFNSILILLTKNVNPNLVSFILSLANLHTGGTRWRSWLRHCATNQKVAGSIPDGVGIFHWHNPSSRTMALGLTQPLTEMSTRNVSWGKGGRCVRLTTLPPSCAECLEIWEPHTPGTLTACLGL